MAIMSGSLSKGISVALFVAGPVFVTILGVLKISSCFPQAIELPSSETAVVLPILMVLTAVFGAIISMPANLVGGFVMGALSERYCWLRPYPIWTMTGLVMGALIARTCANNDPQVAFALIATSTICASVCRHWVRWDDDPVDRRGIPDSPRLAE